MAYTVKLSHTSNLERELELNDLEIFGELSIATITAATLNGCQQNTERTKIVCQYLKKPGQVIRGCRKRLKQEQEP